MNKENAKTATVAASSSKLREFLDLVDIQTDHQRSLHEHLADAFLALAREGYRDPSSALRLANLAPVEADTYLTKGAELRFSKGLKYSPLAPLPSTELREAIVSFRAALKEAVEAVLAREKVHKALDNWGKEAHVKETDDSPLTSECKLIEAKAQIVQATNGKECEWQLVR